MEIEKLILRYLIGEASEQEMTQMQEWLKASKENRQLFARHKKIWTGTKVFAVYDTDKLLHDRKTLGLKISNAELHVRLDKVNRRFRLFAYAASITLLVGITSILYFMQQENVPQQQPYYTGGDIEVPYGSKSLITLPDGSKVWVNAGSKISYPANFGVTSRNVYLTGEAYFDVVKKEDIPFFVNTDILTIKVYGTAFNVKAYKDDDRVETMLDRGTITIIRNEAPDREISVEPNQKITIRREKPNVPVSSSQPSTTTALPVKKPEIQEVKSAEVITAWKDNRLVFDEEPLGSLAKQLERRYNVQIRFNNEKIKSIRYTAAIKEIPIEQVLEAISLSAPISYRIKGTEITLMENKAFKNPVK